MLENRIGTHIKNDDERAKFLSNNAEKKEHISYFKRLEPEEQTALKDELSDVSIDLDAQEEAKKEASADFNAEIKRLKTRRGKILTTIRDKGEQVKEDCFVMHDLDTHQVGYYNSKGNLVDSRPMKPQERQQTIFTAINRTGTDD